MIDCTMSGQPPYNCEGCDLRGRDFAGKDLTNAVLKNADLTGARFRGVVSLRGADLTGAVIGGGTDFSGCDLSQTIFHLGTRLGKHHANTPQQEPVQPVSLVGASVPFSSLGMTWRSLDLTGATVIDLPKDLSGLDVAQCTLTGFDFSGCILKNATFSSTVLCGAKFTGCVLDHIVCDQTTEDPTDLTEASFRSAQIPGGVFDGATLTRADFSDARALVGTSFLNAGMEGTVFDRTDLTACAFSVPPYWSTDPKHLTSFKGATLNYATLRTHWSFLDLTGARLVGLDKTVDLSGLDARYTVLTGWNLDGYTLTGGNLSGATIEAASFVGAHMERVNLAGARGDKPVFDDAILTPNAVFGNQTLGGAVLHGASFQRAQLAGAYLKGVDFGPTLQADGTTYDVVSTFDRALMQAVTATGGDFTAARFTGGVLLDGATFAYATLTSADLTAARLGNAEEMFRLAATDDDYKRLVDALTLGDKSTLAAVFSQHGIPSPPARIDGATPAWTVDCGVVYTVLLHHWADMSSSLVVLAATGAAAASLSFAFMPGVIFTDANLSGVDASYAELWPLRKNHQLAGAIMVGITFAGAILGTNIEAIDLSGASLVGAVLSGATLVNADFSGTALNGARFDGAQLQGADFSTAVMTGVQLTNAAVAVAATANTAGVWLFDVSDADHDALCAELEAAVAGQFDLVADDAAAGVYEQSVADLGAADLTRLRQGFADNDNDGVALGPSATVTAKVDGQVWQIDDPEGTKTSWIVWAIPKKKVLEARPILPVLTRVFADKFQIQLRWATIVKHETDDDQQSLPNWIVDNDSGSTDSLLPGYVQFLVMRSKAMLSVYGIEMKATQGLNQLAMITIDVGATTLTRDGHIAFLAPDTVCPNGVKYAENTANNIPLNDALRAHAPPKPPACVPSRVASCNTPPPS